MLVLHERSGPRSPSYCSFQQPNSASSSSSFQDCPQTSSFVVLMTVVFCKRGSLWPVLRPLFLVLVLGAEVQNMSWGLWACLSHGQSIVCDRPKTIQVGTQSAVTSKFSNRRPTYQVKTLQLINHLTNQSIGRPTRPTASVNETSAREQTFFFLKREESFFQTQTNITKQVNQKQIVHNNIYYISPFTV